MTRAEAIEKVQKARGVAPSHSEALVVGLEALGLLEFTVNEEPVEEVSARTEPPPEWRQHRYHWLVGERSSYQTAAEWDGGHWRCINERFVVSTIEMARRGWRWYAPAIPPAEWQGKRVDAP